MKFRQSNYYIDHVSAGGIAACVHEEVDANNVYTLHVYNMDDTVDQSTTYRFTCYVSTKLDLVNIQSSLSPH